MKRICAVIFGIFLVCGLVGCAMEKEERVKEKDLDFTVLSQEKIPKELMGIIQEKGKEPFQLTYRDAEYLYLAVGYGEQSTGGYSIAVNELYLAKDGIYVNTVLLGPQAEKGNFATPTNPCIVMRTELLEEPVFFE